MLIAQSVSGTLAWIDRLENAAAELRDLHRPITACTSCHQEVTGECCNTPTVVVCDYCCWDERDNARSQECLDCHDHGGEHRDPTPICPTIAILERAGL